LGDNAYTFENEDRVTMDHLKEQAFSYFTKANMIWRDLGEPDFHGNRLFCSWMMIVCVYAMTNDNHEQLCNAFEMFENASVSLSSNNCLASEHFTRGHRYFHMKHFERAIAEFWEAKIFWETGKNEDYFDDIESCFLVIAEFYYQMNNYDKALLWFNGLKSVDCMGWKNFKRCFDLARCHFKTGRSNEAVRCFNQGKKQMTRFPWKIEVQAARIDPSYLQDVAEKYSSKYILERFISNASLIQKKTFHKNNWKDKSTYCGLNRKTQMLSKHLL